MAGRDYVAIPSATLTFAPGQTVQTVSVAINPEPAGTPARTFNLNLSSRTTPPLPAARYGHDQCRGRRSGRDAAPGQVPQEVAVRSRAFRSSLAAASIRRRPRTRRITSPGPAEKYSPAACYTVPVLLTAARHAAATDTVLILPAGACTRPATSSRSRRRRRGGVHDAAGQPLVGGTATLVLPA